MKKIKALFACGLLTFSVISIASCGSSDVENPDYVDPTYNPFGKYDEPVQVEGVMEYLAHNDSRVPANITPDNQLYMKLLKQEFNIEWKYMWKAPATQYENKLTATMLSKKYPDILKVNASQYESFLEKGLLKDLTETYKYAAPKTKEFLNRDPDLIESLKQPDGKIYAIPQYDDINREVPVMYYRKDWLTQNKLEVPTNPTELKNVLQSFKNNQKATAGLALSKSFIGSYFTLDRYLQIFGNKPFSWIEQNDGSLVSSEVTENAKESLKYLNDLYKNGLLSKDFAATDAAGAEANVKTGKAGIIFGPWWQYEYPIADLMNEQEWACAPIPVNPGTPLVLPKQQISYYYVALKGFNHPEILMKMINAYLYFDGKEGTSPEKGYVWSWVPTQFYDPFEVDTQYKQFQEQIKVDPEASGDAPEEWTAHLKNLWKTYPEYKTWEEDHGAVKFQANWFANIRGRLVSDGAWATILKTREEKDIVFNQYTDLPTKSQKDFGGQIQTHVETYYVKAIMGEVDIDNSWESFVNEWNSLGGKKVTAEVNDWYASNK